MTSMPRPLILIAAGLMATVPALAKEEMRRAAPRVAIASCVSREWIAFGSAD